MGMNILILSNPEKDINSECTKKTVSLFERHGCGVSVNGSIDSSFSLITVLGGDGSIMRAAGMAAPLGIPILGINLGRVGYIAELEQHETDLIEHFFTGAYTVENRMMLSVGLGDGFEFSALNDAVICGGISRVADLEISCGDSIVSRYRADGVVVSTPTGSTAYTMSAGGAIIDPHLECLSVTPICPYSLKLKPMVFSPESELSVKNISHKGHGAYLIVDGGAPLPLSVGDTVRIKKSEMYTKLIRINIKKDGFYNIVNRKMSEML